MTEWHSESFKVLKSVAGNEKEIFFGTYREFSILLTHAHLVQNFIFAKVDWFQDFVVRNDFGIIQNGYLAKVVNNWKELNMLRKAYIEGEYDYIDENKVQGSCSPNVDV